MPREQGQGRQTLSGTKSQQCPVFPFQIKAGNGLCVFNKTLKGYVSCLIREGLFERRWLFY